MGLARRRDPKKARELLAKEGLTAFPSGNQLGDPRGTGIAVGASDTGGAETPRPLPGALPPRPGEAGVAVPACALCAFANSSSSYLDRHWSFAKG